MSLLLTFAEAALSSPYVIVLFCFVFFRIEALTCDLLNKGHIYTFSGQQPFLSTEGLNLAVSQ